MTLPSGRRVLFHFTHTPGFREYHQHDRSVQIPCTVTTCALLEERGGEKYPIASASVKPFHKDRLSRRAAHAAALKKALALAVQFGMPLNDRNTLLQNYFSKRNHAHA